MKNLLIGIFFVTAIMSLIVLFMKSGYSPFIPVRIMNKATGRTIQEKLVIAHTEIFGNIGTSAGCI